MSRNVTILVIVLIVVLLGAYLAWLKGHNFGYSPTPGPITVEQSASPSSQVSLSPSPTASASATPSGLLHPRVTLKPAASASAKTAR